MIKSLRSIKGKLILLMLLVVLLVTMLMGATDCVYQMLRGQMQKEAGKRFDPVVVEAFLKMLNAEG